MKSGVRRICLPGKHQAAGALQADVAFLIPARAAVLIPGNQRIFGKQKIVGKTALDKVGEVIATAQPNPYRVEARFLLDGRENSVDHIRYAKRFIKSAQNFSGKIVGNVPPACVQ